MMENNLKIVILAAGKGTRMKSELPKALAPLRGKPMIKYLLASIAQAGLDQKPVIVVGYGKELVMKELGTGYEYAVQEEQLGTGHAVMAAETACKGYENIMVISADQPFLRPETLRRLFQKHLETYATLTISTTKLPDFEDWRQAFLAYGRIIRAGEKITDKEIKDCTEEELKITEVNVSCYAYKADWLWQNIKKLSTGLNAQREYQITDLWHMANEQEQKISDIQIEARESLGANSREELEVLEKLVVQ